MTPNDPQHLLDHLVYGAVDLDKAVATIGGALGIDPVEGGRHLGRGTRNYLFGLTETSYVEIIGLDPDNPADPDTFVPFQVDQLSHDRLVGFAVHPTDMDGAVEASRRHGAHLDDPAQMSRTTPDGQVLNWALSIADVLPDDGLAPFLIDWGTTPHPAGQDLPRVELLDLRLTHPDADRLNSLYADLGLGLRATVGRPGLSATLRGPGGELVL